MEEESTSLKKTLEEIKEQQKMILEKEEKGFKIPWGARVSNGKAKKGWATIGIVRNNGNIEFQKKQIIDGTVSIDKFPRIATIDYKLTYKGSPFLIIPEWSMKPFSPVENYEQSEKEKMNMAGRRLILSKLEGEQIKGKKEFGGIIWVIVIIGAVALGWYMLQGGKLF